MTKISITGPKNRLEPVISRLYDLKLLDIEEYEGELETGEPGEEAEQVSQLLVDLRSTLSKMPDVEAEDRELSIEDVERQLPRIDQQIEEINNEKERIEREKTQITQDLEVFKRLKGSNLLYSDLNGTKKLETLIGDVDVEKLRKNAPDSNYEVFEAEDADIVFYKEGDEELEDAVRQAAENVVELPEGDFEGTVEEIIDELRDRKEQLEAEKDEKQEELKELAEKWCKGLNEVEEFLTEKVEKSEAPLRFATTENTFIAYGWVPEKRYSEIEQELEDLAGDKIHVQREEGEDPPVKHNNIKAVQPFESLTDLVAVPRYNELDPSAILMLTFPLFFGFMIGDLGYGLTTLAVFYLGYRFIDGAEKIFKSLMYASVATIIFGLAFGDAFGYIIFGKDSVLTAITGISIFQQIPVLFHRAHHLGQIFTISAIIGAVHVNLGFLLGFYNEFNRHGFREAFLEKGSWIVLEIGAVLAVLQGLTVGGPVMLLSVIMLYLGEGIEGVVEIPSLISNILSYLRIFGVSVAAVALAAVVNSLANPLFKSGTVLGISLGVLVLVIGHVFNTFIKIMEGFLQGIRLHYVEMFQKFYQGGGRRYSPFGSKTK
ncbi:MAG: V-type ATP synthase subunit I [Candidatus Nanohaloarchaea archaeon]